MRCMWALALVAVASASSASVTPVQKVIELLNEAHEKGEQEMQAEKVNMATFVQWCDGTIAQKAKDIGENEEAMDQFEATENENKAIAAQRAIEIKEGNEAVFKLQRTLKEKLDERAQQKKDYETTHQDLSQSVSALRRALEVLKSQNFDRDAAKMLLLQVRAMDPSAEDPIDAFLSVSQDPNNPKRAAYEFQSGGVIDLLRKLLDKFISERMELETAERNQKGTHNVFVANQKGQIKNAEDEIDADTEEKSSCEEKAADAKAQHQETDEMNKNDSEYLSESKTMCSQKQADFEARQKLRGEELAAIMKAVEILGSDSVSGASEKNYADISSKNIDGKFFLQVAVDRRPATKSKVVALLNSRAESLKAPLLAELALRVQEDPFVKIRELIENLIQKLMAEAAGEAEQTGWCNTELAGNKITREKKSAEVLEAQTDIDKLNADIEIFGQKIEDFSTKLKELKQEADQLTSERTKERETNEQTIEESKQAQDAVDRATTVLKEFYAKAGVAAALIQAPKHGEKFDAKDAPDTFEGSYQGNQKAAGGIMGFLEVIMSDFKRLEEETKSAETQAQAEYDEAMNTNAQNQAETESQIKTFKKRKAKAESDLEQREDDKKSAQDALNIARKYFDKLKPPCIPTPVPLAVRQKLRDDEIQSLKEALEVLEESNHE